MKTAIKKDRLSANDIIQVRKIIEHIYDKILGRNEFSGCQANGTNQQQPNGSNQCNCRNANCPSNQSSSSDQNTSYSTANSQDQDEDRKSLAEEKLELICQEQVLDVNMDLRTVRHFIWKSSSELEIFYKRIGGVV